MRPLGHTAPPSSPLAAPSADVSAAARPGVRAWRDYVQLTKPRIASLCLFMTLGGIALAPGSLGFGTLMATLVGTFLSVASANALNMWWEREGDRHMARTRNRPLPAGRMDPSAALCFGVLMGVLSAVVLAVWVNPLTSWLGLFAIVSYVLVYTPLKRRSSFAVIAGAVPGAMPPLMGWTAATGHVDVVGLVLFALLFVWQIPHTVAISFYCKADYDRAGIRTLPAMQGDKLAKLQSLAYAVLLLPVSLLFVPLGVAGAWYLAAAVALGFWFTGIALAGFRAGSEEATGAWARRFFFASLVYLPALTASLVADLAIARFL